ncbi:hypothetical protein STEG23_014785, partial [Scotinomys teguina]
QLATEFDEWRDECLLCNMPININKYSVGNGQGLPCRLSDIDYDIRLKDEPDMLFEPNLLDGNDKPHPEDKGRDVQLELDDSGENLYTEIGYVYYNLKINYVYKTPLRLLFLSNKENSNIDWKYDQTKTCKIRVVGTREMVLLVQSFRNKHEDLSLIP